MEKGPLNDSLIYYFIKSYATKVNEGQLPYHINKT